MSDPRRFGESKRHEAWDKPGGFTFYHKPKLPPFEFAELDLSAAQAERVRQAATWYLALKQAVPSNTKMLERASKARRKLKAAEKVAREAARTAKQAARVAETGQQFVPDLALVLPSRCARFSFEPDHVGSAWLANTLKALVTPDF